MTHKRDNRLLDARRSMWVELLLLAVLTAGVYFRVTGYGFVNYDDPLYVSENSFVQNGLTVTGIKWAFTTGQASNWHPVTWLSLMLDMTVFGVHPGAVHAMNVLYHLAAVLLLFHVMASMTGDRLKSWFVAAVFAVHPLHVESVAWIAERKDVLSALFWMVTLASYVRYVRGRRKRWYGATLAAFTAGLMAKPMVVTLPVVMLLLDWWPLNRFGRPNTSAKALSRLVREKIPFFILAFAAGLVTITVQRAGGAVRDLVSFPLHVRIANALVSSLVYIEKTVIPVNLAVFYPHPGGGIPLWKSVVAALFIVTVTVAAILRRRKNPWLITGWGLYIVTLAPVIGIVQVGRQAMADRYMYLPMIGVLIAAAWGADTMSDRFRRGKRFAVTAGLAAVLAWSALAFVQTGFWRDSDTLFKHALAVTEDNDIAHNNLGRSLLEEDKTDEAFGHFTAALRIRPDFPEAHANLGKVYVARGEIDSAAVSFERALAVHPGFAGARFSFAGLLSESGDHDGAIRQYERVLSDQPGFTDAALNLGNEYGVVGDWDKAAAMFRRVLDADPGNEGAWKNLAAAHSNHATVYVRLQRYDDALREYSTALEIDPGNRDALVNTANVLAMTARFGEAVGYYEKAGTLYPDDPGIQINHGLALERAGRAGDAVKHYREALRIDPRNEEARRRLDRLEAEDSR